MKYLPCILCGQARYRFINTYPGPGFEGIDLVLCENCELMQAQPVPTEEYLQEYYKTEFGNDPEAGFAMKDSAEKGFRLRATLQYDFVDQWLGVSRLSGQGRRVLDVGCHAASFLSLFKARGWEVTGVDPNPRTAYADKWYGIKVRRELFRPGMFEANTFDGILHSHVLEHTRDPKIYLAEFLRILKPGGWAFIEVPNESVAKVKAGDTVNPHLYFFTPSTLKKTAAAVGFETITTGVLGVEPLRAPLLSPKGLRWLALRSQARYNAKGKLDFFTLMPFFGKILKRDRYFKAYHPEACMLRILLRKPLEVRASARPREGVAVGQAK